VLVQPKGLKRQARVLQGSGFSVFSLWFSSVSSYARLAHRLGARQGRQRQVHSFPPVLPKGDPAADDKDINLKPFARNEATSLPSAPSGGCFMIYGSSVFSLLLRPTSSRSPATKPLHCLQRPVVVVS
jgi:hypothetical protein